MQLRLHGKLGRNRGGAAFLAIGALLMALVAPAGAAKQEAPTDPGAPSGDGVQPDLVQGNPTCADEFGDIEGILELKLEGSEDYDDLTDGVDVTRYSDNTFDFEFDDGVVYGVVVKGGPAGNVYDYTPDGTTSDTGLHAPVNPSNGKYYGLSHISFCYVPVVPDEVELTKTGVGDAPLAGATFQLYRSDDAVLSADDELIGTDTTDAEGIASWEITETGYYFAVETDAPDGYTLLAGPIELGLLSVNDADRETYTFGPVENAPTPGRVAVEKLNDAGDPVSGAQFTLYDDADGDGIDGDDAIVGSCTTDATGACSIGNIPIGDDYLLDETVMPANHTTGTVSVDGVLQDGWPVAITIDLVDGGDSVLVEAVNNRVFTKIVLVCFGNELYQADVTENGETKYTIVDPPAGVDEAVLCGTGGARFEGNQAGDHTLTVGID